jgi:hypothetical protein
MPSRLPLSAAVAAATAFLASPSSAPAQIAYATPGEVYQQNFNTLSKRPGTPPWYDNVTLPGWYALLHASLSPPDLYGANDGGGVGNRLYAYGSPDGPDRALGALPGKTTGPIYFGLRLVNTSPMIITRAELSFRGEQWRCAANPRSRTLTTDYALGPRDHLAAGEWTPLPSVDFTSPKVGAATNQALDGNLPTHRTRSSLRATLAEPGFRWEPGQELWIRWIVPDSGGGHGLAIDDFSFAATEAEDPAP